MLNGILLTHLYIGTDKLYITHSEWASDDTFSASVGSGSSKSQVPDANFRRLPFNYCAISLQPFGHPVCTIDGTIFDLTNILPWLKKHGTNPVDGRPLKSSDLIKLNFTKNDDDEYVDPVTYKPFTNNTHIIALKNTGNVFTWDTVDRLNVKAKNWKDLVSDEDFIRQDIITLQDPQHLATRDLSSFKFLQDGTSTLTEEQERERNDPSNKLNMSAMGSSAKIVKAKEAVAKARAERAATQDTNHSLATTSNSQRLAKADGAVHTNNALEASKRVPYNAATHTTGQAAASFTSTGVTPHTGNERALLSEEDYMLRPRRVKEKGYARMQTSHGDINIELLPEYAPRAVWNFVQLAKRGYYRDIKFHRNIRNFMIQGGDPSGTGKGGQSVWGKPFADEYAQSPLSHSQRGILSMANKGKNTNTSQFFITYRKAPHLDRKHTIFGKCTENDNSGNDLTLRRLEMVETDSGDRPTEDCFVRDVSIFVDPFEEFQKKQESPQNTHQRREGSIDSKNDDDITTWTGKRVRTSDGTRSTTPAKSVGKYISGSHAYADEPLETAIDSASFKPPAPKKRKAGGGFGNFDNW